MACTAQRIDTLDNLRKFVSQTICDHEQLEADAYVMTEMVLTRSGMPCGRYYCLHGPRATKYSAIWVSERNTVLFYDSTGERFLTAEIEEAHQLELSAA
ncbi:MAG TPA: hypothetical protein VHD36_18625 [Pirellulales bacterium]|nr:hypothetical protein [Pirellulales bacterium]